MISYNFSSVSYSASPGDEDVFFAPLRPPRTPLEPLFDDDDVVVVVIALGCDVPPVSVCDASILLSAAKVSSLEGDAALVVGYTAFGSPTLLIPVNRRCKRLRSREVM